MVSETRPGSFRCAQDVTRPSVTGLAWEHYSRPDRRGRPTNPPHPLFQPIPTPKTTFSGRRWVRASWHRSLNWRHRPPVYRQKWRLAMANEYGCGRQLQINPPVVASSRLGTAAAGTSGVAEAEAGAVDRDRRGEASLLGAGEASGRCLETGGLATCLVTGLLITLSSVGESIDLWVTSCRKRTCGVGRRRARTELGQITYRAQRKAGERLSRRQGGTIGIRALRRSSSGSRSGRPFWCGGC
jgi:hypothetical protein